jgi:nucleotide-binding universal stress UspA family protein
MFMIANDTMPRPHTGAGPATDGPVVLAAKPFDGTGAAFAVARWLARREDRELHIVSVLEHNDALFIAAGALPLPQRFYDEERDSIAKRIDWDLRSAGDDVGHHVDVIDGVGAASIVDFAHARAARVIVIGTGRHDPFSRVVYGERAMNVVRLSDRPVLVVPRVASAGVVRHALVAVDFSPACFRAARAVLPMLSIGSRLTLVHVKPSTPNDDAGQNQPVAEGRCEEAFKRFVAELPVPAGVLVETRVLWGNPATVMDGFARTHGVTLIACGRRQKHSFTERMFMGTVSEGLLRRVNCPLLVVPDPQDVVAANPAGGRDTVAAPT